MRSRASTGRPMDRASSAQAAHTKISSMSVRTRKSAVSMILHLSHSIVRLLLFSIRALQDSDDVQRNRVLRLSHRSVQPARKFVRLSSRVARSPPVFHLQIRAARIAYAQVRATWMPRMESLKNNILQNDLEREIRKYPSESLEKPCTKELRKK